MYNESPNRSAMDQVDASSFARREMASAKSLGPISLSTRLTIASLTLSADIFSSSNIVKSGFNILS